MRFFPGFRISAVELDSPAFDFEHFRLKLHFEKLMSDRYRLQRKKNRILKRFRVCG